MAARTGGTITVYGAAASGSVAVEAALTLTGVRYRLVEGATWLDEEARARVEVWRDRRSVIVGQALSTLTAEDRASIEAALPALSRLASALAAAGSEGGGQ